MLLGEPLPVSFGPMFAPLFLLVLPVVIPVPELPLIPPALPAAWSEAGTARHPAATAVSINFVIMFILPFRFEFPVSPSPTAAGFRAHQPAIFRWKRLG